MFIEIKSNIKDYYLSGRLPFVVDSVGSNSLQESVVRPSGFHSHHILWLTEGEGNFTVDGQMLTLKAGQGLFIRKNVPHSYALSGDKFSSRWITFLGFDGLLDFYNASNHFVFRVTEDFNNSYKALYKHSIGQSTVLSRSSLGYQIVTEFLDGVFSPSAPLSLKVDRYLESNFTDNLSLQDIADGMSMNKFTLCKRYSEISGVTVMEKLNKIRVAKAKQYLINTSYSAEKIGFMCGFMSPSYFGKVFREVTGLTPKEYRLKHK